MIIVEQLDYIENVLIITWYKEPLYQSNRIAYMQK